MLSKRKNYANGPTLTGGANAYAGARKVPLHLDFFNAIFKNDLHKIYRLI